MLNDQTERAGSEYRGPFDVPDEHDRDGADDAPPHASLTDDVLAFFDDGKTYAEAEIRYQKSRMAFVANRAKGAVAFGAAAFGVLHLALIAMTVGLVLALIPLVGPWGATAIVTIGLIIVGVILLRSLKQRINDIRSAFADKADKKDVS